MASKTRVSVNGYGVIGKRIADAVRVQPDMERAGIADVVYDYRVRVAAVLDIQCAEACNPVAGHLPL